MSHSLTFIVAGDPAQLTGGYVYDARIAAALRSQGWDIDVIGLGGSFPEPDSTSARALEDALARQPNDTRVVIDGLAMGALPEIVAKHSERLDLTALVHHPLADETGLDEAQRTRLALSETRALSTTRRVIATSAFTARRLADFDIAAERIAVVEPGVDASPLAVSANADRDGTQRLLCVATVTPRKGHDVLIDALAQIGKQDWQCDCIGALDRDLAHARAMTAKILQHGLGNRVHLLGEREPEALNAAYHDADVFVLPSHYEGYGMVVSEALARGLPVITTTGGALAHTLPREAGLAVPPGDVTALADALRRWFEDPELRQHLRVGARQARENLSDWNAAGAAFARALTGQTPSDTLSSWPMAKRVSS